MSNIISHSPFYIQAHRRTAVRVMIRFIIALSRGECKPLFTKCVFCVAKSAIRVFPRLSTVFNSAAVENVENKRFFYVDFPGFPLLNGSGRQSFPRFPRSFQHFHGG
jgi:hypothetical protein